MFLMVIDFHCKVTLYRLDCFLQKAKSRLTFVKKALRMWLIIPIFAYKIMIAAMINKIISEFYPLPDRSLQSLVSMMDEVRYPKGYHLIRAGKVDTNVYFLLEGLVRSYTIIHGEEVTFYFGSEGNIIYSIESYLNGMEANDTVELLEDSSFLTISMEALHRLYESDIHIANWGRKMAEDGMLRTKKEFIYILSLDATQRYQMLVSKRPDLLQRVPLGLIASYCGVTQATLSRIRAKIK